MFGFHRPSFLHQKGTQSSLILKYIRSRHKTPRKIILSFRLKYKPKAECWPVNLDVWNLLLA